MRDVHVEVLPWSVGHCATPQGFALCPLPGEAEPGSEMALRSLMMPVALFF